MGPGPPLLGCRMSHDRLSALSAAVERQRTRHEVLVAQVAELTRRVDRIELRLMLYSMGGAAAGALMGSAGSAAARAFIGG